MDVRIGLIGCGVMGADHAAILRAGVAGARLAAVQDADGKRARALAETLGTVAVMDEAAALIASPEVDAVLIAAPDPAHAPLVLACIAAGKPVLCEKPLADTVEGCRGVVAAEMKSGRRLVQVGFMRRFDAGYHAMRQAVERESLGAPLMLHCVHRNKVAPDYITSAQVIANSGVHEMDIARYLLAEDFAAVTVISARPSRLMPNRQPQMILLESARGVVVSVEVTPDAQYGYDVRGELVCESGTISLAPAPPVALRQAGLDGFAVEEDWRTRFGEAYRAQMVAWVHAVRGGQPAGASAWDGYMASRTAAAALEAWQAGGRVVMAPESRPDFYAV